MKEKLQTIGYGILTIYGFGAMVFAAYFEYLYARENGFMAWLLLGWLVPVIKAALWPFYLFF